MTRTRTSVLTATFFLLAGSLALFLVLFAGRSTGTAWTSRENSEVSPDGSVAVALIHWPTAEAARPVALKLALPEPSVVTVAEPR